MCADLEWLREQGWAAALQKHLRYGGKIIGLCGGYQMLGNWIHDSEGQEGSVGSTAGLGWLDCDTTLTAEKQLKNVSSYLCLDGQSAMQGYEIHQGVTSGSGLLRPAVQLTTAGVATTDGAISADNQILGTYCHGLFGHPEALAALLNWAGMGNTQTIDLAARREADLNRLADAVEAALDWGRLRLQVSGIREQGTE